MHLTSQNSSPNQQRTPQVIGVMQSQNNNTGNRGPRPLEQVTCYKVIHLDCLTLLCCWLLGTGKEMDWCGCGVGPAKGFFTVKRALLIKHCTFSEWI